MPSINRAALGALALATVAFPAHAVTGNARNGLIAMQGLNVIVLENLNATGGETEGKVYVGGDFTGNNIQVGFGNSQQGEALSFHSTLAVGGKLTAGINLSNGSNGGNGLLGSYGAYVVGNVDKKLDLHDKAATIRVGGNLYDIGMVSGNNAGEGTTVNVVGGFSQTLDLRDYSDVTIGCAGVASGSTCVGTVQGGNAGAKVAVTGKVGTLQFGPGGSARIGGGVDNANLNNNQSVEIVGNLTGGSLGNNNVIKVLGNVSNVNGSSGTTLYASGTITGSNANGATFNAGYVYPSGTAPTVPVAAAVGDLIATTAQLKADVLALSSVLGGMAATNFATGAMGNPNQVSFAVTDTDPTTAAVFNLTGAQFNNAQQFQFNLANLNKPVVFNISGAAGGIYNWNATFASGSGLNAISDLKQLNQTVIWNFLDATSVEINREVYGSVLAPLATLHNGSNINGSVVAKIFNQSAEVHLGTYARTVTFIPETGTAVPEPALWIELIAGFGLAGATLRRRRIAAA